MRRLLFLALFAIAVFTTLGCATRPHADAGSSTPSANDDAICVMASKKIILRVAKELERLKSEYSELSEFTDECISEDGLTLHYAKNVVPGIKGTVLGEGEACEIVIEFSPIVKYGTSPIPWGNFTITYPRLDWQVCSYPAAYWIPGKPGDSYTARFGGRFIRSGNLELCERVNGIVRKHLEPLDELDEALSPARDYPATS